MYYEIPKDAVADSHEIYAYLCGVEELAKALQECLNRGKDTIRLKYCLESWEESDGRVTIKYKRKIVEEGGLGHEALMMDCVYTTDVFNDKVNYIDLLAPHLKAHSEEKLTKKSTFNGEIFMGKMPIEDLLTNLNSQLQALSSQLEGLKGALCQIPPTDGLMHIAPFHADLGHVSLPLPNH